MLDENSDLYTRINKEMVSIRGTDEQIRRAGAEGYDHRSTWPTPIRRRAKMILENFGEYLPKFKKIIPHDYERMLNAIVQMEEKGLSSEQAQIEAFYANTRG